MHPSSNFTSPTTVHSTFYKLCSSPVLSPRIRSIPFFCFQKSSASAPSAGDPPPMASGISNPQEGKKKRNQPKRGQIKAKIFGSLVRSVLTLVSKKGGEGAEQSEGEHLAPTATAMAGDGSEEPSSAAAEKQRPPTPYLFAGSTSSLEGFVFEVPKEQAICRFPTLETKRGRRG